MKKLISCRVEDANFEIIDFFKKTIAKAALVAAESYLQEEEFKKFQTLGESTNFHSHLNPVLVALAGGHLRSISNPDIILQIREAISHLASKNSIHYFKYTTGETNSITPHLFLTLQKNILGASGQKEFRFKFGCENAEDSADEFEKAVLYLRNHWKSCAALVDVLISEIHFLSFNKFESGVSLNTYGALFVAPLQNWKFHSYLEILVHEMSHLQLMLHEQFETYLLNPEHITNSPIRADERPLSGVLHGTFALARMTEVHLKLMQTSADLHKEAFFYARHNLNRLNLGLMVLKRDALLSEAGKLLLQSIQIQADEFTLLLAKS